MCIPTRDRFTWAWRTRCWRSACGRHFISSSVMPSKKRHGLTSRAWRARAGPTFLPERVGRRDSTGEVDVVVVSEADGALLSGECKWSVNPEARTSWMISNARRTWWIPRAAGRLFPMRALFAKSGFTPACWSPAWWTRCVPGCGRGAGDGSTPGLKPWTESILSVNVRAPARWTCRNRKDRLCLIYGTPTERSSIL